MLSIREPATVIEDFEIGVVPFVLHIENGYLQQAQASEPEYTLYVAQSQVARSQPCRLPPAASRHGTLICKKNRMTAPSTSGCEVGDLDANPGNEFPLRTNSHDFTCNATHPTKTYYIMCKGRNRQVIWSFYQVFIYPVYAGNRPSWSASITMRVSIKSRL